MNVRGLVKPEDCSRLRQAGALSVFRTAGTTHGMSTAVTQSKPALLPKITARVDVWMSEEMKSELEALLVSRCAANGHRLSLSDLGREAFLRLLADDTKETIP